MASANDDIVIPDIAYARQIGESEMASWKEAQAAIKFLLNVVDRRRAAIDYQPAPGEPRWFRVYDADQLAQFYKAAIPRMREAARLCGYALGVHGSLRRDLDIIAAPWVADHTDRDTLARAVQVAACGIGQEVYQWGAHDHKPCGRLGTVFAIVWCEFGRGITSLGCVDFAVMPDTDRLGEDKA